jgi:hypothetical protein
MTFGHTRSGGASISMIVVTWRSVGSATLASPTANAGRSSSIAMGLRTPPGRWLEEMTHASSAPTIERTAAIGKAIARQITPSIAKRSTAEPVSSVPSTASPSVRPSVRWYVAL